MIRPITRCAVGLGVLALLAGGAAAHASEAETSRALTVDDFFRLGAVSDPQISPDGRWVAFLSDRTGEIIDKLFLILSYPSRWRYDILRALDYFRAAGVACDRRMEVK